ncbi:ferredoxin subunit of nitrite reductase and ring-hydroxylating dioxygenase [Gynuella sunshinyii YC6258]|uniref:Ferredoxin subunit of nitrite reductase and ring-hydroxylating dioxygenase n=2 Tax=Gynuella sunshinyii TaxID=1445505 RepID=A0A0C5VQL5_9GAMM|nr:ferredoxin subunit of nitrite reductase and ring-hydroxylating dioxygenase [Gynuella sunshinyii YC6258]
MAWRRDGYMSSDGTVIVCHVHGARFEPHSGLCIYGPCRGKQLERVDLIEEADGQLFIRQ